MKIEFDTRVQELKFEVLKAIAKGCFEDNLLERYWKIPEDIVSGPKPTMRCCIYKERAIVQERMKLALGGNKEIDNVIEVIKVACDECPLGGYEVTNRCRGCIARRCLNVCHKNAIHFDEKTHSAIIDKDLCVNCGMCAKACQYNAIQNFLRPCVEACKLKAISMDEDQAAVIDDEKCIQCGACVYQCPFGAIMDKSWMKPVIEDLKKSENGKNYPVYAIVAPAIASQFKDVKLGQVVTALHKLGFSHVVEAALGADMVAYDEARELAEKGFLTSSCCPAFVSFVQKQFPTLKDNISHNLSPMMTIAKWIRQHNPEAKIVFVGPCIAKKKEIQKEEIKHIVNFTLTFEEIQAMLAAREIEPESLEETPLDDASYYGRIFARAGGLTEAVKEALKEQGSSFEAKPISVDGMENLRMVMAKAKSPAREFNFIEGMACNGGCIGGPCSLAHEFKDKMEVEKYGKSAGERTIQEAIKDYQE